MALDTIADLGARNVLITQETACFGLFREERQVRRFRAAIARIEPVASVGAGDVLLGGFLTERFNGHAARRRAAHGRSAARPPRCSSSAPAASTPARRAGSPAASRSRSSSRSPPSAGAGRARGSGRSVLEFSAQASRAALEREADRGARPPSASLCARCEARSIASITRPTRKATARSLAASWGLVLRGTAHAPEPAAASSRCTTDVRPFAGAGEHGEHVRRRARGRAARRPARPARRARRRPPRGPRSAGARSAPAVRVAETPAARM